jgi:anti-sigma factor ChrR (cupin superfamily)
VIDRLVVSDLPSLAAHAERLSWRQHRPGVEIHWLYESADGGAAAAFLRYAPGAALARHRHPGYEHIFVLAGAQEDERGRYLAGAMVINPPGSAHEVRSPEGCLVLVIWERAVIFETSVA